jgi:hypothetical protein
MLYPAVFGHGIPTRCVSVWAAPDPECVQRLDYLVRPVRFADKGRCPGRQRRRSLPAVHAEHDDRHLRPALFDHARGR